MSFNGATTIKPWRGAIWGNGRIGLVGFNGATAIKPWRADTLAAILGASVGFNGATAIKPWRVHFRGEDGFWVFNASMGPRLLRAYPKMMFV